MFHWEWVDQRDLLEKKKIKTNRKSSIGDSKSERALAPPIQHVLSMSAFHLCEKQTIVNK